MTRTVMYLRMNNGELDSGLQKFAVLRPVLTDYLAGSYERGIGIIKFIYANAEQVTIADLVGCNLILFCSL